MPGAGLGVPAVVPQPNPDARPQRQAAGERVAPSGLQPRPEPGHRRRGRPQLFVKVMEARNPGELAFGRPLPTLQL